MIKNIKPAILILTCLLVFQGAFGQNSITDHLRAKFSAYTKAVPREEIYIQSDRSEYISGEDIWFKIYLLDRASFKASDSKIAYFELLNKENRPIIQKKIWIDGGFGPGQINLPDTLSTGIYTIRAYTSWMKNFLPYNCFMKEIKIYNSFSNKPIKEKAVPAKTNNESTYTKFFNEGLSMKLNNNEQGILEIKVSASEDYRSLNGNIFYLFIETHGKIDLINAEKIISTETTITIPEKELTTGINQITLFSSEGKPVCELLNYSPDKKAAITMHSPDSLSVREKMSVSLDFPAEFRNMNNSGTFSVSVTPFTNHQALDMADYMLFGSEFGILPEIKMKGNSIADLPSGVIDSLLLNVKSNWINWNAILANDLPSFIYPVEKDENYLIGRLQSGSQKVPDKDKYVILSTPGKNAIFQYDITDEDGYFSFSIPIDEKLNDIIIQPESAITEQSVRIESPFSDQYVKTGKLTDSTKAQPAYVSKWSVNNQVRRIYGSSTSGEPLTPVIQRIKQKRFYGKPDDEIIMKDYIALPVMQEVFFELLPGVGLKKKKAGYELTMNDPLNNILYEKSPALFVDGVYVQDPSVAVAIDPENVEKIEVVREKYYVGDYKFYGVVNIISKTGDFSNAPLQDYSARLNYRAVDPVPSLISPDYSANPENKKRIPDFRNTLYWNPSLKQDKEGHSNIEFWTSDFISDYEINVQGITSDGKPFSVKKAHQSNTEIIVS